VESARRRRENKTKRASNWMLRRRSIGLQWGRFYMDKRIAPRMARWGSCGKGRRPRLCTSRSLSPNGVWHFCWCALEGRRAALRFASADCCHFSARGPPLVNKSKSLFLCVRIPRRRPYETLNSFASLCGTCWEINANPAASINKLLPH